MKIVADFTTDDGRARHGRGCVFVNKTALIVNDLPRLAGLPSEFAVEHTEVRTGLFEEIPFLRLGTGLCQKTGLFAGVYKMDGRFEPVAVIVTVLEGGDSILDLLLLADKATFGRLVFGE